MCTSQCAQSNVHIGLCDTVWAGVRRERDQSGESEVTKNRTALLSPPRMIAPTSKKILVNNLAAGTHYDLCVLAIYDDQVTALTATRVVGCAHFVTEPQYLRCHFMQSQFLGGTIVVIIGGVIVASVLAFIIFLIVRYRVCAQGEVDKVRGGVEEVEPGGGGWGLGEYE